MDETKKVVEINSSNIQSEYKDVILNVSETVTFNHDVLISNCDIQYTANQHEHLIIKNHATFNNCSFMCKSYDDGDSGFIVVENSGELTIEDCKFDSCEKLIEGIGKFTRIALFRCVLINPGNLFLNIQAQENSEILMNQIDARILDGTVYSGETVVFRIARWGTEAIFNFSNIKITAARFQDDIKWFDCMGAELIKGEFTNLSNVLFGFQKVLESKFISCKKVINWSFPVIRDYGISKNAISWINENVKIEKCNFTNCTMIAGLGHLAKLVDSKFVKCYAPLSVVGQYGGVEIIDSKIDACILDDNKNNALFICVLNQDQFFDKNLISGVECKNTSLKRDKFLKIGLSRDKSNKEIAYKPVFELKKFDFYNCELESLSQLITDRAENGQRIVELGAPISFVNNRKIDINIDKSVYRDESGSDWFGDI